MIKLKNNDTNIKLKCGIAGYQFPDDHEDNWCLLKIEVQQDEQIFEATDAALYATELTELYEWFQCLSENRLPTYAHLSFFEPCISFKFLSCKEKSIEISVLLDDELKPDFALKQSESDNTDWNIVFKLSEQDFEKILEGIKTTIKHFPVRGNFRS